MALEEQQGQQQLLPIFSNRSGCSSNCNTTDASILEHARQHPLVSPLNNFYFSYGTAGFRYKADLLDGVMLRVGMAAALLPTAHASIQLGVMITASHNDEVSLVIEEVKAFCRTLLDETSSV
jgi:hypothetical protein